MSQSTVETSEPILEFTTAPMSPSAPRTVPAPPAPERRSFSGENDPESDFNYRPVPIIAPMAFFLGICSIIGLFGVIGLVVGLVGVVLGAVAIWKIRRNRDEYSGLWMPVTGLILSSFFLLAGSTMHGVAYATEVPEGFERVNFTRDISKKGFGIVDGEPTIHPDVRQLDGKQVFLKGYMYPEHQIFGIKRFIFVKDNGQCCFGGQPKATDMILVEMEGGKTVNYVPYLVSVAGTFHALAPEKSGELKTVYRLDGSYFSPAKTSF